MEKVTLINNTENEIRLGTNEALTLQVNADKQKVMTKRKTTLEVSGIVEKPNEGQTMRELND